MRQRPVERIKVTPVHVSGMKSAPYFIMEFARNTNLNLKQLASDQAKQMSRLGNSEQWQFVAEKL